MIFEIVSWGASSSDFDSFNESKQQNGFCFQIEFDVASNNEEGVLQYSFLYADKAGLLDYIDKNSYKGFLILENCLIVEKYSLSSLQNYIWDDINNSLSKLTTWKELLSFLDKHFSEIE